MKGNSNMLTPSKAQKAFPYKPCSNFSSYSHIWLPRFSQNPTEWSQEEKVQKCCGGRTDALWKQKRLNSTWGGDNVSFRGLLISNSLLLFQISTSSLWQSNCLQKLETLDSLSCTVSFRIKVLMSFVCSIFYEKKPECKFKLKGD